MTETAGLPKGQDQQRPSEASLRERKGKGTLVRYEIIGVHLGMAANHQKRMLTLVTWVCLEGTFLG